MSARTVGAAHGGAENTLDERTPLIVEQPLIHTNDVANDVETGSRADGAPAQKQNMVLIIPFLMLGVFVANIDGSIVMANFSTIGSEFGNLSGASWIVTSYFLGLCAMQPLVGKLSDIYGRKPMLMLAYIFFSIGTFTCGMSRTFWGMITGRVVTGVGSAGMTALVSILITDLVPVRSVAFWRSFVYMAASLARSSGGPIGGIASDTVGWRASFIGQSPFALLTLLLVGRYLRVPTRDQKFTSEERVTHSSSAAIKAAIEDSDNESTTSINLRKFRRLDIAGSATLACAVVAFLLVIDLGAGLKYPFGHPYIVSSLVVFVLCLASFVLVEWKWAMEPIFPLRLLGNRDVIAPYMVECSLSVAQLAMLSTVALYFRVTAETSNLGAALRMILSNAGYILGSFSTGLVIRKTGQYRVLIILATCMSAACSILLLWRWRGETSWWETLYIIPGGFSCGVGTSATFVALTAALDPSDLAIAGSGYYLMDNLGVMAGVSLAAGVVQGSLRMILPGMLEGVENRDEVMEKVLDSVENIWSLPPDVKPLVVSSYVKALEYSHFVSLGAAIVAIGFAFFLREHKMN